MNWDKKTLKEYENLMSKISYIEHSKDKFQVFFKDNMLSIEVIREDNGTTIQIKCYSIVADTIYLPIDIFNELSNKFNDKAQNDNK